MRQSKTSSHGFTLIELLVVIAVIGILAAVVMSSLATARAKGRDAKRLQDMNQIRTAIEMYFSTNGYYPTCGGNVHCDTTGAYGALSALDVVPTQISSIGNDPSNAAGQYGYYYGRGYIKTGTNTFSSTGLDSDYILGMRLERGGTTYSGWGNNNLNWLESNRRN